MSEQLKLFSFATKEFLQFGDQTDRKQSVIDFLDKSSPSGFSFLPKSQQPAIERPQPKKYDYVIDQVRGSFFMP
jgi:hypothetical protein